MEFLSFFLFFIFFAFLVSLLSYYANLLFFRKKAVYQREEITEPWEGSFRIFYEMLDSKGNLALGIGLLLLGGFFSFGFSLLGGAIGTPHYTDEAGNYFFHFPWFFWTFLFSFPFLETAYGSQAKSFFVSGRSTLSGLGLGSLSASFGTWALYHEMPFWFSFLLLVSLPLPLLFFWNSEKFLGIRIGPATNLFASEDDEIPLDSPPEASFSEDDWDLEPQTQREPSSDLEWDDLDLDSSEKPAKDPW